MFLDCLLLVSVIGSRNVMGGSTPSWCNILRSSPMFLLYRPSYGQAMALALTELGEKTFVEAMQERRDMSLEQVLAAHDARAHRAPVGTEPGQAEYSHAWVACCCSFIISEKVSQGSRNPPRVLANCPGDFIMGDMAHVVSTECQYTQQNGTDSSRN